MPPSEVTAYPLPEPASRASSHPPAGETPKARVPPRPHLSRSPTTPLQTDHQKFWRTPPLGGLPSPVSSASTLSTPSPLRHLVSTSHIETLVSRHSESPLYRSNLEPGKKAEDRSASPTDEDSRSNDDETLSVFEDGDETMTLEADLRLLSLHRSRTHDSAFSVSMSNILQLDNDDARPGDIEATFTDRHNTSSRDPAQPRLDADAFSRILDQNHDPQQRLYSWSRFGRASDSITHNEATSHSHFQSSSPSINVSPGNSSLEDSSYLEIPSSSAPSSTMHFPSSNQQSNFSSTLSSVSASIIRAPSSTRLSPIESPSFPSTESLLHDKPQTQDFQRIPATGLPPRAMQREDCSESHYLLVWDVPRGVGSSDLKEILLPLGDIRAIVLRFLEAHGAIILAFYDLRHASEASKHLEKEPTFFSRLNSPHKLRSSFISQSMVEQLTEGTMNGPDFVDANDGRLVMTVVSCKRSNSEHGLSLLGLQSMLDAFGDLKALRVLDSGAQAFLAEFFDSRSAANAQSALHNHIHDDTLLLVAFQSPCRSSSSPIGDSIGSTEARPLPAQTDRGWPSQPSRDLFDGASVAAEGSLDTLFLGRRGSTTSSLMGSPSASLEKFPADNVSLDGSLNGDRIEDTPLSNYFKQGRRLSNAVAFDRSKHSALPPSIHQTTTLPPRPQYHAAPSAFVTENRPNPWPPNVNLPPAPRSTSPTLLSSSNVYSSLPPTPVALISALSESQRRTPSAERSKLEVESIDEPPASALPELPVADTYRRLDSNLWRSLEANNHFESIRHRWYEGGVAAAPKPLTSPPWSNNLHRKDPHTIPEANKVILERILQGREKRTTVMVKDVPNKLTRDMLLTFLDSVCPLGYDFVYLRIDFKNKCNVGYAFVNFSSMESLYEFARVKMGVKWNVFASEKVLQLSFANIQGKEALIDKFRNSAVLLQEDAYRPILFHSIGPLRGLRQPFPPPTDIVRRNQNLRSIDTLGSRHPHAASLPPAPVPFPPLTAPLFGVVRDAPPRKISPPGFSRPFA